MICPGRPFWWANHYYGDAIKALEIWCGISRGRHFLTPSSNWDALERIESNLSDCGRTQSPDNALPGEIEFFGRVQKLADAIHTGNTESIRLMVQAIRKHFDADCLMSQELDMRCRQAYKSEAANKVGEEDLRRQISDGTLSIADAAKKLEAAQRKTENDAFQAFYASGGEERIGAEIWQDPILSEQHILLIQEAAALEEQAKDSFS